MIWTLIFWKKMSIFNKTHKASVFLKQYWTALTHKQLYSFQNLPTILEFLSKFRSHMHLSVDTSSVWAQHSGCRSQCFIEILGFLILSFWSLSEKLQGSWSGWQIYANALKWFFENNSNFAARIQTVHAVHWWEKPQKRFKLLVSLRKRIFITSSGKLSTAQTFYSKSPQTVQRFYEFMSKIRSHLQYFTARMSPLQCTWLALISV